MGETALELSMVKWKTIVSAFFRKVDPENSFTHLVNAAATLDAIDAAEKAICIRLPSRCAISLHTRGSYLRDRVKKIMGKLSECR